MSQELKIHFSNAADSDQFINRLAASPMRLLHGRHQAVLLKDATLGSTAEYDVGVLRIDAHSATIEILFKTQNLYLCLAAAVAGTPYQCVDETDDQVSLEDVFRVRLQSTNP
jgi:hypothetical protein